jgi:hypothetical protein
MCAKSVGEGVGHHTTVRELGKKSLEPRALAIDAWQHILQTIAAGLQLQQELGSFHKQIGDAVG